MLEPLISIIRYLSQCYIGRAVCTATGERCESSLLTPSQWGEHHTTAHKMRLHVKGEISAIKGYHWHFAIEMTRDSLLILEGLAAVGVGFFFFRVNGKHRGMHPVRGRALHCTKELMLFGHIKGKGLAKQLCPDTSLLAENWHPHRTPYQLSCLLYSLGWLRSCFFCSPEYEHPSCVPFQLSCCRSAISHGGHVHLMARGTNESEKINTSPTEESRNPSKWWESAANGTFSRIWCYFRKLSPDENNFFTK